MTASSPTTTGPTSSNADALPALPDEVVTRALVRDVVLPRTVGGEGKLYGSVTHKDIEAALKGKGFEIDRKKIVADPIRATGTYEVTARLAPEISSTFKVHVVADAKSAS